MSVHVEAAQGVAYEMSKARTPREACEAALGFVKQALGATAACIYSLEDGRFVSIASDGECPLLPPSVEADGKLSAVLNTALDSEEIIHGDPETIVGAALLTGHARLGALVVEAHKADAHFRHLLRLVAACLSQALERLTDRHGEGRLRATETELLQALRQRDEFLSIASHELNTPLTSLQLNLEQLGRRLKRQSSLDTDQLRPGVDGMTRQVQRLGRLLGHLLDFSRIRTQRFHLDIEAFELCDLVDEMKARFQGIAAERGSELRVHRCERLVGYWDRLRVEQVLSNLLSNALKYGAGRPVDVSVSSDGDTALVSITDHGIGIAEEDLSRIFVRYERATPLHQSESCGLGLFISREIARAHGGDIEVRSELGRGSTFVLRLPIHRVHVDEGP